MIAPQVGRFLRDSTRSAHYWVRQFDEEGLAGIAEGAHPGRPRRFMEAQLKAVGMALRQRPKDAGPSGNLWDSKTLSAFLQRRFSVDLGVRQCQRLFRQLGFRLRKPRPMLPHPHPELQAAHQRPLAALNADPTVDLWVIDEVHFQQHGSRCLMWVPPGGEDPILLHARTHNAIGH